MLSDGHFLLRIITDLFQTHLPVHFVVDGMRLLTQILHVGLNEHFLQLHKVAMGLVLDLDDTPRVLAPADGLVADLDELVAAHDGEREEGVHRGVRLGAGLVVGRELVDAHAVRLQLGHDAEFELGQLALGDVVRLCDYRDDVHLRLQLLHAHQVDRLQSA